MSRGLKTEFLGVTFRSRVEAQWAVFFTALGLKWEYEPKTFEVAGTTYTPDFYLADSNTWVEVKNDEWDLEERKFYKYAEAVATVLSDSQGLVFLGGYTVGGYGLEIETGRPMHRMLVKDELSPTGAAYCYSVFEESGPKPLEETRKRLHTDTFEEEGFNWIAVRYRKTRIMPATVKSAYGIKADTLLDCNPRNVARREQNVSGLTDARINGVLVMLTDFKKNYSPDISWKLYSASQTKSRKKEWHIIGSQGVKVYELREIEKYLLQLYAAHDLPLPVKRLEYRNKPGYVPYLEGRLATLSDTVRKIA